MGNAIVFSYIRILGDEREERPPQFAMRLRDRRVQVTYPVRLTCQIIGYPAPEIIWFKNAVEITQDGKRLSCIRN